jgi:hypothetical protein
MQDGLGGLEAGEHRRPRVVTGGEDGVAHVVDVPLRLVRLGLVEARPPGSSHPAALAGKQVRVWSPSGKAKLRFTARWSVLTARLGRASAGQPRQSRSDHDDVLHLRAGVHGQRVQQNDEGAGNLTTPALTRASCSEARRIACHSRLSLT